MGLLDLDGVVYVGPDPVPGAPEQLRKAAEAGLRIGYITNNASRPPDAVAEHLRSFGLTVEPGDVVTSAQAAARLVAAEFAPGSRVMVVGGDGIRAALAEYGLTAVPGPDDEPVAVVQGFAPQVSWRLLADGARAVNAGAKWFATNLDLTIPTPGGRAPGNGALVRALRVAVDVDPVVAGKPEPPLLETSIERLRAERPLMIGDRLDTDIAGAYAVGIASLWVATGVNTPADLVNAPVEERPTYVGSGLSVLSEPHPPVIVSGDRHRCGGWEALVSQGNVRLSGDGLPYDGLRATLSASWDTLDRSDGLVDAQDALSRLGLTAPRDASTSPRESRDTVAGDGREPSRRT